MAVDNSKLVFAPGNQWLKEKDAAPFFGLPAWWRRFMFQILSPREVTIYLYMCSVMDPNAVAYPTPEQIAEDMAIRSRSVVVDALAKLVDLGFLLRSPVPYRGRIMGKRVVYQRPLPHYTLFTLLELGLIDADLYPTANQGRNLELTQASDEVVRAGLRRMMDVANFTVFENLEDPAQRKRLLMVALKEQVPEIVVPPPEEQMLNRNAQIYEVYGNLTDEVKKLVEEDPAFNEYLNAEIPF